jgi:pseudaminic acid cytidylyltransferase
MSTAERTVAIVPARGGSKRIPRKNIRDFLGKPIIAYALDVLRNSRLFDAIVVSTDDDEIADVSRRYGADVPFRRPAGLSDDRASTDAVLLHAISECQRVFGPIRLGCCVYPTSPLLSVEDLVAGRELLLRHEATSAFPVVRYDFPIEQALVMEGARARARWPEKLVSRSQELTPHYHDAGMFYWFDVAKYVCAGELFCDDNVVFVVAADRCQDINTPEDWASAELKYRIVRGLS